MGVLAMPSLGADMEDGTLVEWLVAPGDRVRRGDIVAVVETQKGAIEIECFEDGTVEALLAGIGRTVPVGTPIARLRGEGEAGAPATPDPRPRPAAPPRPPARPAAPPPPAAQEGAPPPASPASPASPAARLAARERGIDLAALAGSGPGGAIVLADVEAAPGEAAPTPDTPSPGGKPGLDLAAMRAAIASAMSRSKREIPHYYLTRTIDLQPAADWLAATNAGREPARRLLMGALLVMASARAAARVPEVNGQYGPEGFRPSAAVHAGLAVSLRGGGLIAPAIRDADGLGPDDLMARMRDLVARARTGRLRASEMTEGTITVSSLGEGGADALAPIVFPPQVAILGFGSPMQRPWVVGGEVVPRTVVTATLAADHRVSDGRTGAKLLAGIERILQAPEDE